MRTGSFILLLLTMASFTCAEKGKDYQKEYDQRVILTWLLTRPDPQGNCVLSMQKAESCLTSSTLPPAPVNETTLSLVFSQNQSSTYSSYCTSLLQSAAFSKFSPAAKECSMKCNTDYWNTRISLNQCAETFTSQLTALTKGTTACNLDCFKLFNNDVP